MEVLKQQTVRGFTKEPAFTKSNFYADGSITRAFNCGPPRGRKGEPDWDGLIAWLHYLLDFRESNGVAVSKAKVASHLETFLRDRKNCISDENEDPANAIRKESKTAEDYLQIGDIDVHRFDPPSLEDPSLKHPAKSAGPFDIIVLDGKSASPGQLGERPVWARQIRQWASLMTERATVFLFVDTHPGNDLSILKDALRALDFEMNNTAYYVIRTKTKGRNPTDLHNCVTTILMAQRSSATAWNAKVLTDNLRVQGAHNYYLDVPSPSYKVSFSFCFISSLGTKLIFLNIAHPTPAVCSPTTYCNLDSVAGGLAA